MPKSRSDISAEKGSGLEFNSEECSFGTGHNHHPATEPTVAEWFQSLAPTKKGASEYARDIFMFLQWLPRYNLSWLVGDSIAGIAVGLVVIPQAMAYALLASLTPEYGLYTSFTGAVLYWLFGTSKDVVISVSVHELLKHN